MPPPRRSGGGCGGKRFIVRVRSVRADDSHFETHSCTHCIVHALVIVPKLSFILVLSSCATRLDDTDERVGGDVGQNWPVHSIDCVCFQRPN